MFKKTLLAAVVFGIAATAVQANEVSGYVTGSVGYAKADKPKVAKNFQSTWNEVALANDFTPSSSTDRSDTGYKIAVGLKVNPYLALEAQYIDLGESSYKGGIGVSEGPVSEYYSDKIKANTNGLGVNLIGTYPIESFTLFAKAGLHYLKTKNDYKFSVEAFDNSALVGSMGASNSKTVRQWTPSFGVGASYALTKELAVVAEYERYQGVSDGKMEVFNSRRGPMADVVKQNLKHDIDFASLGLRYNF